MKSQHLKAHTFVSHTSQDSDQSLQKNVLFSYPKRNSIFFPATLLCFYFFAIALYKTDKQSKSLLQPLVSQSILTRKTEARTGNTVFKSDGMKCKLGFLCFVSNVVLLASFVLRNPPKLKARKH